MPSVLVGTTAIEILPRNRLRKSFVVQNEHTTATCFLKRERTATPSVSSTDHDHRLPRETPMSINSDTDGKEAIDDRWTIISDTADTRVSFFETEDVVRT